MLPKVCLLKFKTVRRLKIDPRSVTVLFAGPHVETRLRQIAAQDVFDVGRCTAVTYERKRAAITFRFKGRKQRRDFEQFCAKNSAMINHPPMPGLYPEWQEVAS